MIPIAGPAAPGAVPRHKPAVPVMTTAVIRRLISRVGADRALIAGGLRKSVVGVMHAVCAVIWAYPGRVRRCGRGLAAIGLVNRLRPAATEPALRTRDSDTAQHQNSRHDTHLCRIHSSVFLSARLLGPFQPSHSKDGRGGKNVTPGTGASRSPAVRNVPLTIRRARGSRRACGQQDFCLPLIPLVEGFLIPWEWPDAEESPLSQLPRSCHAAKIRLF